MSASTPPPGAAHHQRTGPVRVTRRADVGRPGRAPGRPAPGVVTRTRRLPHRVHTASVSGDLIATPSSSTYSCVCRPAASVGSVKNMTWNVASQVCPQLRHANAKVSDTAPGSLVMRSPASYGAVPLPYEVRLSAGRPSAGLQRTPVVAWRQLEASARARAG
ncbi:hypothetical protein [Streptomyces sp. LN325]|uniref:hypothetical protein n=1 Tax=Streptomyces sp. LN325 TaxID=3112976 RepID=UPI00371023C3